MSGKGVKAPPTKSFNQNAPVTKDQEDFARLLFFAMRLAENLKNAELESGDDLESDENASKQASFFDELVKALFPDYYEHPEKISDDARSGLDDFWMASRRRYGSVAERDKTFNETTQHYATIYEAKHPRHAIVRDNLLNLIAGAESGGNYNIAYGGRKYDLENMTVHEVRALQRSIVRAGGPSSAMGRYQIMGYTMDGLIKEMGLTGSERFDRNMQDSMAIKLAERRGLNQFLDGSLSASAFANKLTKEWAGLKNSSGTGEYDGDGYNRGSVGHRAVVSVLNNTFDAVRAAESAQVVVVADNKPKTPGSGGPVAGM